MIEQKIKKLFEEVGLGNVAYPIESVSGGFLHRMYKVRAGKKTYAVKHLNPVIMKRPDAISNFTGASYRSLAVIAISYPIRTVIQL